MILWGEGIGEEGCDDTRDREEQSRAGFRQFTGQRRAGVSMIPRDRAVQRTAGAPEKPLLITPWSGHTVSGRRWRSVFGFSSGSFDGFDGFEDEQTGQKDASF